MQLSRRQTFKLKGKTSLKVFRREPKSRLAALDGLDTTSYRASGAREWFAGLWNIFLGCFFNSLIKSIERPNDVNMSLENFRGASGTQISRRSHRGVLTVTCLGNYTVKKAPLQRG